MAERLTENGIHLTEHGLERWVRRLPGGWYWFGRGPPPGMREEIVRKNQLWFDCWRPATGRSSMVIASANDTAGLVEAADSEGLVRTAVATFAGGRAGFTRWRLPAVAPYNPKPIPLAKPEKTLHRRSSGGFTVADRYEVNLYASEVDGVVKPIQFSWDEKRRLYVACSPTYPQTLASSPRTDYILVLEDTNGDGRADRSHRFAEGLTMVQGVEPGAGGLYVCDFDRLLHLKDTDGDGRADIRRVLFSGFGIGDTHQLVNSISHGPDGSLWFTQGLHAMSRVESPWGIARLDRSAVWRLRPRELRLGDFLEAAWPARIAGA